MSHGHSICIFCTCLFDSQSYSNHDNDLSNLLFSVIIKTVGLTCSAQSLYILNDCAADMLLVGIVIGHLMIV